MSKLTIGDILAANDIDYIDYIDYLKSQNAQLQARVDELETQNEALKQEIEMMTKSERNDGTSIGITIRPRLTARLSIENYLEALTALERTIRDTDNGPVIKCVLRNEIVQIRNGNLQLIESLRR